MHTELSVSTLSFGNVPLTDCLVPIAALGVRRVGVPYGQILAAGSTGACADALGRLDLAVTQVSMVAPFSLGQPEKWEKERALLLDAVETARAIGAELFYVTTGAAPMRSWEEAADAFTAALGDVLPAIQAIGVPFAIENTPSSRPDLGFVSTLTDAVYLAKLVPVSICFDIAPCWQQARLGQAITDHTDQIALVQLSDAALDSRISPDRLVPGDGIVPLAGILASLANARYSGTLELEIMGPRIDVEGAVPSIARGLAHLDQLLRQVADNN